MNAYDDSGSISVPIRPENGTSYDGTAAGNTWSVVSARRFLYDGFNLVGEFSSSDLQSFSLLRSYTWGLDLTGGLTAAGGVGGLVQVRDTAQGKTLLPSYDGNGHVASLVNADTGTLEAAYEYDPFGQLLRAEGAYAKENPFRFSTQFVDDETGLVYHNARYYNPNLGRFINRDPIEEAGGLNLYAYVSNDAANKFDVLGRMGRGAEIIAEDGGINDVTNELTTWLQTEIAKQSAIAQAFGDPVSEVLGRIFGPIDSSPVERAAAQAEAEFIANFNVVVDFQHALGRAGLGRDDSDPSLVGKTVGEVAGILGIPTGKVTIGPVIVADDDDVPGSIASQSPSEVAAAPTDTGTVTAAPSTTTVPTTAAPDTALDTAKNTNAVGAGKTVVPNANDTLLGKLNLLVATVGGQTADSALDIATVAALGAQEGLRDHVGISGDIALNLLPVPRAGQFGPFPAGIGWGAAVDANFKDGITGNQYVTVGKFGAAGSLGITFDIPFFGPGSGGQTASEFTLSGGIGPGGALKFGVDRNGNLTDIKITIGVGFGFELGGAVPFPKG